MEVEFARSSLPGGSGLVFEAWETDNVQLTTES
jgi:hypothetical protein